MRYDFETEPLELDMEIEGESANDEFEYSDRTSELEYGERNGEFESDGEYDRETGTALRRVLNQPKIVDRETYEEFELGEEISPPSDTRMPVKDTTIFPFRFICDIAVKMKSADGRVRAIGHGSGTLIGNKHVLTVGHNIKINHNGVVLLAESIVVTPGRNTAAPLTKRKPFGSVEAQSWKAHPSWIASFDHQYDFALITLKKEIGKDIFGVLGKKQLGFWGSPGFGGKTLLRVVDPASSLKDLIVNVGGYPADKCGDQPLPPSGTCPGDKEGGTQFCGFDKVIDPVPASAPTLLWHNVDSKPGQSGAPVWRWDKATGQRNLVGVHTGGVVDAATGAYVRNTAVRITRKVLESLTLWGWRA
jgi:V8-like Glu-specific endopeptidase